MRHSHLDHTGPPPDVGLQGLVVPDVSVSHRKCSAEERPARVEEVIFGVERRRVPFLRPVR